MAPGCLRCVALAYFSRFVLSACGVAKHVVERGQGEGDEGYTQKIHFFRAAKASHQVRNVPTQPRKELISIEINSPGNLTKKWRKALDVGITIEPKSTSERNAETGKR